MRSEPGRAGSSPAPPAPGAPGPRLLILALYPPGTAPSARFRYEQYLPWLAGAGFRTSVRPFYSAAGYRARAWRAPVAVLAGLARRLGLILAPPGADVVLVCREAMPVASALVEWWFARVLARPLVYDIDDALWHRPAGRSRLAQRLRIGAKIERILRLADRVVAGNRYLAEKAARVGRPVAVIPTVVDTETRFAAVHRHQPGPVTIGWTGSRSTAGYLEAIAPMLAAVAERRQVRFLTISDRFPELGLATERVPWSETSEVEALARADIGLMPMPDDPWARGKCGFKIVQYMALGIVPVASAVGANREILSHGEDGFLCSGEAEWIATLIRLIDDPDLRARIGARARAAAVARYSLAAQAPRLIAVLGAAAAGMPAPAAETPSGRPAPDVGASRD